MIRTLTKKITSDMEVSPLLTLLILFDTVFTVSTIQSALHCLNSSMYELLSKMLNDVGDRGIIVLSL